MTEDSVEWLWLKLHVSNQIEKISTDFNVGCLLKVNTKLENAEKKQSSFWWNVTNVNVQLFTHGDAWILKVAL